jgi:hypothetical protein
MSWPPYLLARAVRAPEPCLRVVSGSTAVVTFGDPVTATVATLGINLRTREFLDGSGWLLSGTERRLASLEDPSQTPVPGAVWN